MSKQLDRRGFFKAAGAAAGAGILLNGGTGKLEAAAVSHVSGLPKRIQAQPCPTVRVGFIGVGGQGTSHVRNFLNIEGMELRAVCDLAESKVANVQQMCQEKGMAKPEGYFGGPEQWRKLVDRDDLDLVYIATPWELHVPMAVAAMKAGKHAATEVPFAVTLDECWELVETSESHRPPLRA